MTQPRKPARHPAGASFDATALEQLVEAMSTGSREHMPTAAERALGIVGTGGLPALVALSVDELLVPALVAANPDLTLGDLDEACDKLEDLAILLLAQTRAARNDVAEQRRATALDRLAVHAYGEAALDAMEPLVETTGFTATEAAQNRKRIRAALPRSAPGRRAPKPV